MSINLEELLGELDGIVGELHNASGLKPPELSTAQQFKLIEQEEQRQRSASWNQLSQASQNPAPPVSQKPPQIAQKPTQLSQKPPVSQNPAPPVSQKPVPQLSAQQQEMQRQLEVERQEQRIMQLQKSLMQAQQMAQRQNSGSSQSSFSSQSSSVSTSSDRTPVAQNPMMMTQNAQNAQNLQNPGAQNAQKPPVAPRPRALSPPPPSASLPPVVSPRSMAYPTSPVSVTSPTMERKISKSSSNLDDKRGASLARNGSIRNAMMALFFSPLSKKEEIGSNMTIPEDSEPIPSLDGGEYDFSDEEEEEELQPYAQSATGGSLRTMPKSATMSNLSDVAKGDKAKDKEKERDKDKVKDQDKGMRKSMSANALEKAGRTRSSSLSEDRVLNVTPFAFTPDPGSEIEISLHDSGKLEVSAGSVSDLVDFLAPTGRVDSDFIADFFYSYRYFVEASVLVDYLILRFTKYNGPNEDDPSRLVPIRVLNVIRKWLQKHPYDFTESPEVEDKLNHFLAAHAKNPEYSRYIASTVDILKEFKKQPRRLRIADAGFFGDTMSSVRKKMQSIPVVRLDVKMVARQLSLREMDLFQSIELKELLHQVWANQKTSPEVAPNLFSYISWFNKTTSWVATEVCMAGNIRLRVSVLKFFITVARYCASWNNFNTVFEIVSGLSLPSVSRLRRTWSNLPSKYMKTWQHLSSQLNPQENFKAYRALLKEAKLPCLPYIGVYLNDLVYAESGTSTFLSSGKVNFFKMATIAKALSSITHFQEKDYGFPMDKKMQQWFSFSMVVMDEDLLFKASLRCEPDEEVE